MYPIKGTFVDEITYDIPSQNWSLDDWKEDLDNMKSVGIDTVIFVRGFFENKCIFPSKLLENKDGVVDLLGFVLKECEKRDMKVYIGMYIKNLVWDYGKSDNEIQMNDIFTDEIIEKYSQYKSFYGWYIPHEVGNDCLNICDIYYSLSKMCKEKTPDKKVLISPFFLTEVLVGEEGKLYPNQVYDEWDKIFAKSGQYIDYCAFQDGSAPMDTMESYFINVKKACDKHHVELWQNVELMARGSDTFLPNDISLIAKKIEVIKPYVTNVITFEFSHFMSPKADLEGARKLYKDYKEYYK